MDAFGSGALSASAADGQPLHVERPRSDRREPGGVEPGDRGRAGGVDTAAGERNDPLAATGGHMLGVVYGRVAVRCGPLISVFSALS